MFLIFNINFKATIYIQSHLLRNPKKTIMKKIKLFAFTLFLAGLILTGIMPFQSCEPDDEDTKPDTCDDREICDTCLVVYKPNIYIYPEEKSQLTVKLNFPLGGSIIKSIPEYGSGWNITVDTNGRIDDTYNYLFYESQQPDLWQENEGWVIKRADLKDFFSENMAKYGFSGAEIQDFVDYWIPRLTGHEFYAIYPQQANIIDKVIELNFSKQPDALLRLFYVVKGLKSATNETLQEPTNDEIFNRKGFYVTEWGVILK
jgi:hypothetical protein